ncbi:MAG: hypothetical protein K8R88_02730, partial [Armatimonadetes bacterium]|nr:hypothetical protein [Armatimonadota bacterium]
EVRSIHRRYGSTDAYFVASSSPFPNTVDCRFRVDPTKVNVQLWHPETGAIEDAPVWRSSNGGVEIPIDFDCTGSVFVVFPPKTGNANHITSTSTKVATESARFTPHLRILKATYGDEASGKFYDVTQLLNKAIEKAALRINAFNSEMGGDPAVDIRKTLQVTYELNGETKSVVIPENGTLAIGDLPQESTPPVSVYEEGKLYAWQNGTYGQTWSNGRKTSQEITNLALPSEVTGSWKVKFTSTYDPVRTETFDKLMSWTESENFDTKYFSGTGTYSKTLTVSKDQLKKDTRLFLDLGDVRELCRIRLNGKLVATLWKAPFRVDITELAKSGKNALEVDVTNLWTNRLIGDEQFPDDMGWNGAQLKGWPTWFTEHKPRPEPRRKTFTTWRHNFKDTPLLPSGLMGPVVLRAVRVLSISR